MLKKPNTPEFQKMSRHMKRILVLAVVVIVVCVGVAAYCLGSAYLVSQNVLVQQKNTSLELTDKEKEEQMSSKEKQRQGSKSATVVNLVSLLGKTKEEALAALESRGAKETQSVAINELGNDIKTDVTIALTNDPADLKSGTPCVTLGLNEEGVVIRAGYASSLANIGYGALSYIDAVTNEHVIEKTVGEAGLSVPDGSAVLPESKLDYSSYSTDGITLVSEAYAFTGTGTSGGETYGWDAVLVYDYTLANASGNLADTVRSIAVQVSVA